MADKNFARSGTADTDLLAEDDPLAELARLVGYEPRPVQNVDRSFSEPDHPEPRRENPVLALEDELLRAFEQYDAPRSEEIAEPAAARHVEPVFDAPEPLGEDPDVILDEVPTRDVAAGGARREEPSFEDPSAEPSFAEPLSVEDAVQTEEAELELDPSLLLADELEAAVHETPAVEAEPVVHSGHAGHQFADRLEPKFEEPVHSESAVETYSDAHSEAQQPAFLGLQPLAAENGALDDVGLDLERELELSIGNGLADDLSSDAHELNGGSAESAFVEPLPAAAEPDLESWTPDATVHATPEPFHAEPAYAHEEAHFVAEMPFENQQDRARAVAEAQTQWQAEEPALEAAADYRVESVEAGLNYDRDALLAEVERYPVPETRPLLSDAALASMTAPPRQGSAGGAAAIFGRATPVAHRQPVAATPDETVRQPLAEAVAAPAAETRYVPAAAPAPAVAEPEMDFENLEFDLSDIALDLSDFSLDETPMTEEAKAPESRTEAARPVEVPTPVRREPAVAVPVSNYTAPQPVAPEMADGSLPFDPTMIAETDEGVSPVAELDVPQLPVIEKEKPQAYQPDYDFDIDAEMAQLFTEPAAKAHGEDLSAGVAAGAVAAAISQPTTQINDVDDFERALEEDFRRSLSQPERMAIPVDPGQANTLYAGDGYDDEQPRAGRGLMIAASVAGLLLIGGGGVYAWNAFTGGTAASGEPRVILADKEPVKVVPEERGGKTVPNQDKAVYDRVAGDTAATPRQEQLVTSTEEPIDVVQRTLTPETLPFDGEDGVEGVIAAEEDNRVLPGVDEPETATAENGKPLVSPRKVKTMIVKPDGTLVAREDTVSAPETAQLDAKATATTGRAAGEAAANTTLDTNASLSAEQAAAEGQPRSALAEAANAEVEDTAPVRTVKTTAIGAAGASGGNAPVPGTRPVDQPVNVVGTVTENGRVAGTQTAEAKPAQTQVAPGEYVIQIASLPSEAEAQKSYNSLSSKFSSVIGGRGVDIKKAEIPNKGVYYRVRIPAGSREEANSLCNRYKSAGGSCLVTR